MKPVFSVIIPTYNRAHLLSRAIESVLSQTFKGFELIVVDDASTDATKEVMEQYEDNRISYLKLLQNGGPSGARNAGILRANGEYISFLDDDDEYLPEYLATMHHVFKSASDRVGFAWGGIQFVRDKPDGETPIRTLIPNLFVDVSEEKSEAFFFLQPPGSSGLAVRSVCFDTVGLFDAELRSAVDLDLVIRLVKHYRFQTIPDILLRVHSHSGRQVSDASGAKVEACERIIQKHSPLLHRHPEYLSFLYCKVGKMYYSEMKNKIRGRRYMLKSLTLNPFRWTTWRALLAFEVFGASYRSFRDQLRIYRERFLWN